MVWFSKKQTRYKLNINIQPRIYSGRRYLKNYVLFWLRGIVNSHITIHKYKTVPYPNSMYTRLKWKYVSLVKILQMKYTQTLWDDTFCAKTKLSGY